LIFNLLIFFQLYGYLLNFRLVLLLRLIYQRKFIFTIVFILIAYIRWPHLILNLILVVLNSQKIIIFFLYIFIKYQILLSTHCSLFTLEWIDKWLRNIFAFIVSILRIIWYFSRTRWNNHLFLVVFYLNIFMHPTRLACI